MSKGFGIAALVLAIIAIFFPFGIILSAIAIVLAIVSALAGDKIFSIATALIALVNTFVLSPSTWIMLVGSEPSAGGVLKVVLFVACLLPVGAVVLHSAGKLSIST